MPKNLTEKKNNSQNLMQNMQNNHLNLNKQQRRPRF